MSRLDPKGLIFLAAVLSSCASWSQISYKTHQEVDYALLRIPPRSPAEKFPLIVAFHGSGGSGVDYIETWADEAERHRAMVLAPTWDYPEEERELGREHFHAVVEQVIRDYPVDRDRIYLAGVSAGALIAQWLAEENPRSWRGLVLIAYSPSTDWAERVDLGDFPAMLFVFGGKDSQYSEAELSRSVLALSKRGANARLFLDPEGAHEHRPEWNHRIFDWLEATGVKS